MDDRPVYLVGCGSDSHIIKRATAARAGEKPLLLAGTIVSTEHTAVSHSDGDAVYHALTNALLLAIGERDIGYHFPDTDARYAGANSESFVREALSLAEGAGYRVSNATVMLNASEPKISEHIPEMKKNLAHLLGVGQERIGIGASRGEGTWTGTGALGIYAIAQVSLVRR